MARLLIYLSFLSLPGADELGLLFLTVSYVGIVILTTVYYVVTRLNSRIFDGGAESTVSVYYSIALLVFLPLNFFVAQLNQVEPSTWLSRSVHLSLIPAFYLCFKLSRTDPEKIFRDICAVGYLEVALVYAAFFVYLDEPSLRRATDIEGVIIYSIFFLCAGFDALKRFDSQHRKRYMGAYFLVLLAAILTGTRILMAAVALLPLCLRNRRRTLLVAIALAIPIAPLATFGMFDRFNFTDDDNVITISSKLDELVILFRYFLDNPLVGVGFGKAYQVSIASSEYTYSHNILLFYLGYAGIVGTVLALFPLMRMYAVSGYRVLVVAIFVFYTSSTSYTNVKHSILLALLMVLVDHRESARNSALSCLPARPSIA